MRAVKRLLLLILTAAALVSCDYSHHLAPVSNAWYQPQAKQGYYRVRPGDTLYSIAWAYGLDYHALARANKIAPPYYLKSGQLLKMTTRPGALPNSLSGNKVSKNTTTPKTVSRKIYRQPNISIGRWRWPARGKVAKGYTGGFSGSHGIDIAGRVGEPVHATAKGIVVYSGDGVRGYGNLIILKHNDTYMSAYGYNQKLLVRLGQRVNAGQAIATMGRTSSGKAMLHFEIRRNGQPVNPMNYLH